MVSENNLIGDPARLEAVTSLLQAREAVAGDDSPPFLRNVRVTALSLRASACAFLPLAHDGFVPIAAHGLPASLSALPEWPAWAFLREAALTGPSAVPDLRARLGAKSDGGPAKFPAAELPAFLGAPVSDAKGRRLGTLAVFDSKPREWAREDLALVSEMAGALRDECAAWADARARELAFDDARAEIESVLGSLDTPVIVFGADGEKLFANEAASTLLGYDTLAAFMRAPIAENWKRLEFIDGDRRPVSVENGPSRRALRGETVSGELIGFQPRAGGALQWSIIKATPVLGPGDDVRMAVLIFHDITALKQAQESATKHMRYLEGVNSVSDAIERTIDVERALPAALERLLDVFDCDRVLLIHLSDSESSSYRIPFSAQRHRRESEPPHPESLPPESGFEAVVRACRATEDPVVFGRERPMPNPDWWANRFGIATLKAIMVRPQVGRPWILCMLRAPAAAPWKLEDQRLFKDVAWRIATSLGSMLLYRDLRRSEEKYRTLFERSLDGIYRCAPDGTVLDANPALVALFGCEDRGQLVGTVQQRLLPAGAELLGPNEGGETFSVEIEPRQGGTVWVEVNAQAIRRANGEIAYYEGMVRNINDRKRAEEALKASEEKLRQSQKMEAVGRLAGGVAHDFNNLLTAINGFSDLLLMSVPKEDKRRGHLEEIRKAGGRAAALTGQLLAFSRKQVLAPRLLDLNAVVSGMETMLRRLIGEDIGFRTRLDPDLPKVVADPNQMEQVILNLVLNARDAMPGGGELLVFTETRVHTGSSNNSKSAPLEAPDGEYAVLSVCDTGTGMDAETKLRLFEPFFTTKQKDKGTGLGLSTVYGAVKQSNGAILVDSEPGRGTVFSIYLPATSAKDKPEKTRMRERALRSLGGHETILLVEDEDAVRRLVRDVLEVGGYKVLEAPGGEQALDLVAKLDRQTPIHLLLTDVVMGGISGRQLAERLRQTRPETRVIFMSGYTEDAIIRHGVFTAEASFISKPFNPAALSAKVREVLDAQIEA